MAVALRKKLESVFCFFLALYIFFLRYSAAVKLETTPWKLLREAAKLESPDWLLGYQKIEQE